MKNRGLKENLKLIRIRFDQEFKQVNLDDFLKDFFNSPAVRSALVPILSSFSPAVKEIKYNLLRSTVTSMDFFDPLEKYQIMLCLVFAPLPLRGYSTQYNTALNGYIKKSMEEYVNGVEVADKLRYFNKQIS